MASLPLERRGRSGETRGEKTWPTKVGRISSLALVAVASLTVGCRRAAIEPSRPWEDPVGAYRSGNRLKIAWASAAQDPRVRWPVAVIDTVRGRRCEIVPLGDTEAWCVPAADETLEDDDIAFLDASFARVARVVDEARCREATPPDDRRAYALSVIGLEQSSSHATPRERANRYQLEEPRLVEGAFTPEGPGCLVRFPRSTRPLCVQPLRPSRLDDLPLLVRERIPGAPAEDGQAIRYRSPDGAVLPHPRRRELGPALAPDRIVEGPTAQERVTGARLAYRVRVEATGSALPVSLRDLALDRDCEPRELADGVWRCVVLLPGSCVLDRERRPSGRPFDEPEHEVLAPSPSYCDGAAASCCAGGTFFLPEQPAVGRHRSGDGPAPHPAIPERTVSFASWPRRAASLRSRAPEVEALVYDHVGDLEADAFARMDLHVDP